MTRMVVSIFSRLRFCLRWLAKTQDNIPQNVDSQNESPSSLKKILKKKVGWTILVIQNLNPFHPQVTNGRAALQRMPPIPMHLYLGREIWRCLGCQGSAVLDEGCF